MKFIRAVLTTAVLTLGMVGGHLPPAGADDGSVETVGGAVRLMKPHSSIRMVSETVKARIAPELVEVDCEFLMRNDGAADTVLVGFPDGAVGGEEYEMERFRSWVDGKEVVCRRLPNADSTHSQVGSWWTKRVFFPAGAQRRIRNSYAVFPSWQPVAFEAETDSIAGFRYFRYILWTGASWKGTISSARITATLSGIPLERVTESNPQAQRTGRTFRWTLRDFEPGSGGAPEIVELGWRVPPEREELPGVRRE